MLWFGLVSRVGASYRVNLIAPFPLGRACPRNIDYEITKLKFNANVNTRCLTLKTTSKLQDDISTNQYRTMKRSF